MQSSLDPVQTVRYHDHLDAGPGSIGALRFLACPRLSLDTSLSRRKSSDYLLEAPLGQRIQAGAHSRDKLKHGHSRFVQLPKLQDGTTTFVFTRANHGRHKAFEFSPAASWPFRGIKRCRVGSDVDGPNTATLNRKKRRLRSRLITSRLSQPFSQPATHILNRQGRQVGDRRFLKMATTLDVSRRTAYLQATSYLRYSIMNRLRRRLGIVKQQGSSNHNESPDRPSMDTSAKAPWQPQGARPSPESTHGGTTSTSDETTATHKTAASTESSPPPSHGKAPACRLSKPRALPLPIADVDAMSDRSSTRIDSTPSPEPRPTLSWSYDDHEEDSYAFLYLDEEHSGDDEPEHVYCDFDSLFGAKQSTSAATTADPLSPDEHTYEEYMDELDGISWRIG